MSLAPPPPPPLLQALPSLSTLIQGIPSTQMKPQKPADAIVPIFDQYHHHHNNHHHHNHHHHHHNHHPHSNHLTIPKPGTFDCDNGNNNANYSMPSPVSPRRTRCGSLASLYSNNSSNNNRISKSSSNINFHTHNSSSYTTHHRNNHDEKLSKHEKRRRNHLNSEKKRRENIKSGMDALFALVPACRDQQESKANILKKTRDFIIELQRTIYAVENECRRLAEENRELKRWAGSGAEQGTKRARL